MSDLDLSALTEAVADRLDKGDEVQLSGAWPGTSSFVDGPLSAIVRAVLEALPREWGCEAYELGRWIQVGAGWSDLSTAEGDARDWRRDGYRSRVVWRAVGPPIPAEDQP